MIRAYQKALITHIQKACCNLSNSNAIIDYNYYVKIYFRGTAELKIQRLHKKRNLEKLSLSKLSCNNYNSKYKITQQLQQAGTLSIYNLVFQHDIQVYRQSQKDTITIKQKKKHFCEYLQLRYLRYGFLLQKLCKNVANFDTIYFPIISKEFIHKSIKYIELFSKIMPPKQIQPQKFFFNILTLATKSNKKIYIFFNFIPKQSSSIPHLLLLSSQKNNPKIIQKSIRKSKQLTPIERHKN
eukprot:TRINITY_DN18769_c0_g2_i1.p2 TRINITY_DN18769_c0_g2~~TRINITY_DN18769_c0_g2_i1.p2  ORF type:complete len:240 (+),score=-7.70 TRINITY_DN18769_c0_g2_i1:696-1415(+)